MSVSVELLWVLGAITALLTLRRKTRPAPPVPVHAARPNRNAQKEQ